MLSIFSKVAPGTAAAALRGIITDHNLTIYNGEDKEHEKHEKHEKYKGNYNLSEMLLKGRQHPNIFGNGDVGHGHHSGIGGNGGNGGPIGVHLPAEADASEALFDEYFFSFDYVLFQ